MNVVFIVASQFDAFTDTGRRGEAGEREREREEEEGGKAVSTVTYCCCFSVFLMEAVGPSLSMKKVP